MEQVKDRPPNRRSACSLVSTSASAIRSDQIHFGERNPSRSESLYSRAVARSAEKWAELVQRYFGFLGDHDFGLAESDDSSFWTTWVQYRSSAAAIRVERSNEFQRVDVYLVRLVDGEVPPYPIWIIAEQINWVLLDNVLEARGQSRPSTTGGGLTAADLERQLAFWAESLINVAPEFLDGDMRAIDDAAAVLRARVEQHPQQVRVFLPSDASPDAETKAVDDVSRTVPSEVSVEARRYKRPRHGGDEAT